MVDFAIRIKIIARRPIIIIEALSLEINAFTNSLFDEI